MALQDWDRLPGENAKEFARFVTFRDMPPEIRDMSTWFRTIQSPNTKSKTCLPRWYDECKKFKWVERSLSYDNFNDRLKRDAVEQQAILDIEENGKRRREFKSYELQLAEQGFRKVKEVLDVAIFTPDSLQEPNQIPKIRLPANLMMAASALFKVSSQIGRQALGIKDDEIGEDVTPEQFKDVFFRTRGQLEQVLPNGAMPSIPAEVAVKPDVFISSDANGHANGNGLVKPERVRP